MALTKRQSESARSKLITLLPRLRRFSKVLAGDRDSADALLRSACKKMLGQGASYQHGTAFDIWAFGLLHNEWLAVLRSHELPISQGQADAAVFEASEGEGEVNAGAIAGILATLPPQQRSAALLLYGEGFSYDEAAIILDIPVETVIARVSRALASFIERADWLDSSRLTSGKVEQLNRQAG